MKIRSGFVSNSSSSSYVVAYRPEDLKYCEHCQRGDQDPVEMARLIATTKPLSSEDWIDNENRILWDSIDSRIETLKNKIEKFKALKDKLLSRPAGDAFCDDYDYTSEELKEMESHLPRVWQQIHVYETTIRSAENSINRLKCFKANGYSICSINIKYDQPEIKKLDEMVKRGVILYVKEPL